MATKAKVERLLTPAEVGKLLRLTRDGVVRMCLRGDLPGAFRLGGARSQWRIPEEAVRVYCAARAAQAERMIPRRRRGKPYVPAHVAMGEPGDGGYARAPMKRVVEREAKRIAERESARAGERQDEDHDPDGNVLEQG